MSKFKITPTDDDLVNNGAWFNYMGVRLKIARLNNDNFKAVFRRLSKPYTRNIKNETISDEDALNITCKAMAEAILLDWDSKTFPGNLEYSKENAFQVLMEDEDCRDFVTETAKAAENFYTTDLETVRGNSPRPSSGT